MSDINKEVGFNIRRIREELGITPDSIATKYPNLEYSRLGYTIVLNILWQTTTYLKEWA